MKQREQMICHYIKAYNHFDISAMLADLDPSISFQNISDGKVDMSLEGVTAFKEQAEKAATFFKSRQQKITSFMHFESYTDVEVAYSAVLAVDLPNGLRKGDALHCAGKSVFHFGKDKIVAIEDISYC
ncbi:hypothetical protein [Filimonas lacunae]|nr:hypothetical protein [Filimonas lacunae]BAV05919.1 hypothetical protein FLA_1931 [Filimonas lacunae]